MGIIGIGYIVYHIIIIAALIPVVFLLVGLGRRIAGGVVEDWTHGRYSSPGLPSKLFFGLCMGLCVFLGLLVSGRLNWQIGIISIVCGFGAWLGHIALGLWNSAGMGRYGDSNQLFKIWGLGRWNRAGDNVPQKKPGFVLSCCGMTAYGLQVVATSIAASFCPFSHGIWEIELFAALLVAPIYAIQWWIWPKEKFRLVGFNENPLPEAEWMFGFVGVAVYLGFALYV